MNHICRMLPSANEVLLTYIQLNVGESLPIAWVFERAFELAQHRGSSDIEAAEMEQAIHESASLSDNFCEPCPIGHAFAVGLGFKAKETQADET